MNKLEVAKLYKVIKKRYSNFDASLQAVEEDLDMLKDIPYEVAQSNFRQHIMTSDFPPKISQIRGRLGEQLERERMRKQTEELLQEMDISRLKAVPPPAGLKEEIYARLNVQH
ncbi:replicative helicase loader/inhibitor [Paenibacillus phytohabitans]|uniref:replicative helicase loader/inhibitor n=1 Tax=Paenibacillus phytohabitans TaxID=2654978 RepID=UPI00300857CF